jgi:hypothetical protein
MTHRSELEGWEHVEAQPRDVMLAIVHPYRGEPQSLYYYDTPNGIWAITCRFEDGFGKAVLPYSLWLNPQTGKDRWCWKCPPGPRPLYRLGYLIEREDPTVFMVEGEKTAEAAWRKYGLLATTWLGGASAVAKTDFSPLKGRDVTLVADNDRPGIDAMIQVEDILTDIGVKKLKVILPHPIVFPTGWDIADPWPTGWDLARLLGDRHVAR